MQAINAFKLLPSMLSSLHLWGCRSKKEQQKREEECVSGIEMCVHAHFNFVNFSPSSSFFNDADSHGNDEVREIKKSTLDPSFAVFFISYAVMLLYECICS